MNLFRAFQDDVVAIVEKLVKSGSLPEGLDTSRITVEPPRDATHGDISTNAAMLLAKPAGMKPRDVAEMIAPEIAALEGVAKVDVAGPGFINAGLTDEYWHDRLVYVLKAGTAYGASEIGGGEKINVEYVSANPTGPLHVAHARGAVIGDALVNLLRKAGFDVTSEYYINDAGNQVDQLARSANLRYREALGEVNGEIPEGVYPEDYEPREQTLFRATDFGDDTDRPLKKSDGSWTYFSNDIANHLDKYERGFKKMIDIWGADHGGYVKRMQAAVRAVTDNEGELDVKLCQIVHLKKGGEPFRMSKRSGNFVTLRDLIEELGENGKDVVRFIMLTRKNDSQMDFDLEKAVEQSRDNPVFYVQYAHARCHSVLRNAAETLGADTLSADKLVKANLKHLDDAAEIEVIRTLAAWPKMVEAAAEAHEPHRVAFYLDDLASVFHGLWNKGKDDTRLRFIDENDEDVTRARLALVLGVATVIASGLEVIGVTPLEELR